MKLTRLFLLLPALLTGAVLAAGTAPQSKSNASAKSSTKPPASKSATKSSGSKTTAKASGTKSSTASKKKKSGSSRASQQQPEPQRIREIQQALTEKGFPVEVDGVWNPQTVDALKRFQEQQNIDNLTGRGKLDPLTLTALGLGPRREPPATGLPAANPALIEGNKP